MHYNLIGHPLLRCPVGVSSTALDAQACVAEDLLGLTATRYTGERAQRAANAVALQVNYQLARPKNPFLRSQTRGARAESYSAAGERPAVLAEAAAIVAALAGEVIKEPTPGVDFAVITSLR